VEQLGSGDCGHAELILHHRYGKRFSTSEVAFYVLVFSFSFGVMTFLISVVGDDEFPQRKSLRLSSADGSKEKVERWVNKLSPTLRQRVATGIGFALNPHFVQGGTRDSVGKSHRRNSRRQACRRRR
jgi:hypothetical protein